MIKVNGFVNMMLKQEPGEFCFINTWVKENMPNWYESIVHYVKLYFDENEDVEKYNFENKEYLVVFRFEDKEVHIEAEFSGISIPLYDEEIEELELSPNEDFLVLLNECFLLLSKR